MLKWPSSNPCNPTYRPTYHHHNTWRLPTQQATTPGEATGEMEDAAEETNEEDATMHHQLILHRVHTTLTAPSRPPPIRWRHHTANQQELHTPTPQSTFQIGTPATRAASMSKNGTQAPLAQTLNLDINHSATDRASKGTKTLAIARRQKRNTNRLSHRAPDS